MIVTVFTWFQYALTCEKSNWHFVEVCGCISLKCLPKSNFKIASKQWCSEFLSTNALDLCFNYDEWLVQPSGRSCHRKRERKNHNSLAFSKNLILLSVYILTAVLTPAACVTKWRKSNFWSLSFDFRASFDTTLFFIITSMDVCWPSQHRVPPPFWF